MGLVTRIFYDSPLPKPDYDLQLGDEFRLPQQKVWTHGSDDPADWSVYTAKLLNGGEVSRTARGPLFKKNDET